MSITDLQKKRGLIIGGVILLITIVVIAITLIQVQTPQEVRQRAAEPICPAQSGSCEWDTDPSVSEYSYTISEEGSSTEISGTLKNPQIETNLISKEYELRYTCDEQGITVYATKPNGSEIGNYDFALNDVTNPDDLVEKSSLSNIDIALGYQGFVFENASGSNFIPEVGKRYQISIFPFSTEATPGEELAKTAIFTCPSQVVKTKVNFTPIVNTKYTCTVSALNVCGESSPTSAQATCTALTPTPTNTPTPTVTPITSLTPTPTRTPTPIPTSTPIPTRTPTPTITPFPTSTPLPTEPPPPTAIPTVTAIPTSTPVPPAEQAVAQPTATPQPTLPPTGNSLPTALLIAAGAAVTVIGAIFFFVF